MQTGAEPIKIRALGLDWIEYGKGMVGPVTELPLNDSMGFGFRIGVRFEMTLTYRTEREATVARQQMLDVLRGATVSERWARR